MNLDVSLDALIASRGPARGGKKEFAARKQQNVGRVSGGGGRSRGGGPFRPSSGAVQMRVQQRNTGPLARPQQYQRPSSIKV